MNGNPSSGDEWNDKEEENFGVISRGRKRELPKDENQDKDEDDVVEEEEAGCLSMIF